MIQLKVLSGKMAGACMAARRFPLRLGRGGDCGLRFEEDGVWERHARLDFLPEHGYVLTAEPNALTRVNGSHVEQAVLRNGDTIELGSLKLRFWLSEARQVSMRVRELLTFSMVFGLFLAQVALIYCLLR